MTVLLASLALVAAPHPIHHPRPSHSPCSIACIERVKTKIRHDIRVRHRKEWRAFIAPYVGWLRSTRSCESGGDYKINTGNGFYGAYQFVLTTWQSMGGRGLPNDASPLEQDYRAVKLLKAAGTGPWPVCG
jgi:hypothetical protein